MSCESELTYLNVRYLLFSDGRFVKSSSIVLLWLLVYFFFSFFVNTNDQICRDKTEVKMIVTSFVSILK